MPEEAIQVKINDYITEKFINESSQFATAHWLSFKDFLEDAGLATDADKIRQFRRTLAGEPRVWFSENEALFTTVKELEKLFKSAYGKTITRQEYLKRFRELSIKSGEELSKYRNRVRSVASKAKITDAEQIMFQFVDGLPAHIRPALRAKRDTTLEECMLTAQALLSEQPSTGSAQLFAHTPSPSDQLCGKMDSLHFSHQGSSQPHTHSSSQSHMRPSRSHQNFSSSRNSDSRPHSQNSPSSQRHRHRSSSRSDRSTSRSDRSHRSSSRSDRSQRLDRSSSRGRSHYSRNRSNSRDRSVSFNQNDRSNSPVICRYCNIPGHKWASCYKLEKAIMAGQIPPPQFF